MAVAFLVSSCVYLQNVGKQTSYSMRQEVNPSQRNQKYMIDRQTFFTYGRIVDEAGSFAGLPLAIGAYSDEHREHELVDITHVAHTGTYYGLNLPAGSYDLIVFADLDRNGVLEQSEVVGRRRIELDERLYLDKVVGDIDVLLDRQPPVVWTVEIPVQETRHLAESVFFPKGAIRSLDDPLFDPSMASLGMYEPAVFLEQAPTMFYALEEDSYKTPVVFVHGIGGSAREFESIVAKIDRDTYKPWFFYYPSGSDLAQLADFFYRIFLSGQAVKGGSQPLVIVAHSMGGLVVREAMNRYHGETGENRVDLIITLASPFGGHPSAASGAQQGPLVLPSWLDLDPEGPFIEQLFRKPLPADTSHHLFFAYGNQNQLKLGDNSDGVVPLFSQLRPIAQQEAAEQFGFDSSHTGILHDDGAVRAVIEAINSIDLGYPESHIAAVRAGGFDVELGDTYTDQEKHYIRTMGTYMSLLANGTLDPSGDPVLEHFVDAAQGRTEAWTPPESAWLKFVQEYPELGD